MNDKQIKSIAEEMVLDMGFGGHGSADVAQIAYEVEIHAELRRRTVSEYIDVAQNNKSLWADVDYDA
jgi:hypothetical protein